MWFPKFPYTNFSQINLDWVLRQIRELSEWMNRYFKDIRQDIDKEINDRIEGDKALNARVDKEISDRTEADTALGKRIDKEIADRTKADNNLQSNIDAEKTAREEADRQLQANIDAEKTAREEADRQLQANIDAEKTAREEADEQLAQDAAQLRTDAILKDGSTTTTAAIPFQEGIKTGSISEVTQGTGLAIESELDMNNHTIHSLADGAADADAVNKRQLDTVSNSIHSIPSGGTPGQVLAKINEADYNVTWVNQQGGGSGNVPAGGTTGQVLAKSTDTDYQTEWVNQPEGLPTGGTEGQVVTKTADGVEWADASSGLPAGGSTGQVVTKTANGAEWLNIPKELPDGGTTGQVLTKTASGTKWTTGLILENEQKISSSVGNGPAWKAIIRVYRQSNTIFPYKIISITPDDVTPFSYQNGDFTDFGTQKIAIKQSQEIVLPEEAKQLGIAWQNDAKITYSTQHFTQIFEITTINTSSTYNNIMLKLYTITDTPTTNKGVIWPNTTYWFPIK